MKYSVHECILDFLASGNARSAVELRTEVRREAVAAPNRGGAETALAINDLCVAGLVQHNGEKFELSDYGWNVLNSGGSNRKIEYVVIETGKACAVFCDEVTEAQLIWDTLGYLRGVYRVTSRRPCVRVVSV